MNKKLIFILIISIIVGFSSSVLSQNDELVIPIPIFEKAEVEAGVVYNSSTGLYTYSYSVTNPSSNTGEIYSIDIYITQPKYGTELSSDGLTIPHGYITDSFDESLAIFKGDYVPMVPVGIVVPSGWGGGIGASGFAGFGSKNEFPNILPGETKGGFQLISRGLPTIRSIEIEPWWIYYKVGSPSKEDADAARAIEDSLRFITKTIGPTAPPENLVPATFLDTIEDYIDESVTMGWLIDSAFVESLKTKLYSAQIFIQDNDPSSAKVVLGEMMDLINQATSSQITSEAKGLLFYNVQYLKEELPDTYIPSVKTLSLTPEEDTLPLGTTHILTVTSKIDGDLLPYYPVTVQVTSGPNEGLILGDTYTDSNGEAVFSYTSTMVGTDTIFAQSIYVPASLPSSGDVKLAMNDVNDMASDIAPALGLMLASNDSIVTYESTEAYAEVTWSGGPDLTIPFFIPPVIKTQGGNTIYITDITENNGEIATIAAGDSITRYYISEDTEIDPETDIYLGERSVTALEVGESSEEIESEFQVPAGLPSGTYYCFACADAENVVAELDELNNCVNNELSIVFPVEVCGDFNDDFKVDVADYQIIRGAFGAIIGDARYIEEADYDNDGNIDASDYQLWYNCYKAFINR